MTNIVCSTLESIKIPELIAQIKEIMAENEAHNLPFFSETMWRWRYMNLPSGKSFVYIVRCAGKIVGYYHVPIYKFIIDGIEENVAMVQDVAICSQMRGAPTVNPWEPYSVWGRFMVPVSRDTTNG